MRILVAGGGAIGGTIAVHLADAGADVTIIDSWYQHVQQIKNHGLRLSLPKGELHTHVPALNLDEVDDQHQEFDLLLLAVKSYDTAWMLRAVLPMLKPESIVVSLQNGMNEPIIADIVGGDRTIGGVVHMSCEFPCVGHVRRTTDPSWATLSVGSIDGSITRERIDEVATILSPAGRVRQSPNINETLWMKLTVNCMGNAMSVVTGLSTCDLWSDVTSVDAITHIGGEAVEVAHASGIRLEPIHMAGGQFDVQPETFVRAHHGDELSMNEVLRFFGHMAEVRSGTHENKASMLQDWQKRRRTEVQYLNSYVAKLGSRLGISARYNAALSTMVWQMERGELEPTLSNARLVLGLVHEI